MSDLLREIKHTFRGLRRTPAFLAVVVLTLTLGIGANTALFSVIRSVLLSPLGYRDAERIVVLWSRWKDFPEKTWVGAEEYQNYTRELRSIADLALFDRDEVSITEGDEPERVSVAAVTPNLFRVLGVGPLAGRVLTDDDAVEGRNAVVVIGEGLWRRRYAGDPGVIGRSISLDGDSYTIVGVAPADFRLPMDFSESVQTQIYAPLPLPAFSAVPQQGGSHGYFAVGRLAPGATVAGANAELKSLVDRMTRDGIYPPQMQFGAFVVSVIDEIAGPMKRALYVLLGAVAFVLIIACANVANLMLVRAEDRRRETTVRAALGATRAELLRGSLLESSILALFGGVGAVLLAWFGIAALRAIAPATLPRVADASLDGTVLLATLFIALATAFIFGIAPALHASRPNLQETLKESGRANTGSIERMRFRRGIVAAEVALAVVLVVGAALMLRSFWNVIRIDPGFRSDNVLTMRLSVPSSFYATPGEVNRFYQNALERVRAVPGVSAAGIVRVLPIDRDIGDSGIRVEGYVGEHGSMFVPADWQAASDGYFEALRIPLVEGRTFTSADRDSTEQVIIVNRAFVKKYLSNVPALNHRVRFGFRGDSVPWQRIVGVVEDVRHNGLIAEVKPAFYRPHAQWPISTGRAARDMTLVVRSTGEPLELAAAIQREVTSVDPRLPVSHVQTMDQVMETAHAQSLFTFVLLAIFGGLALVLAMVGIYGVVSYGVAQRRQELGIRAALGARPAQLVQLALQQGLTPVALGLVAGIAVALASTRVMQSMLVSLRATDPLTYAAVAIFAIGATLFASWIPARRAARANPLEALRNE